MTPSDTAARAALPDARHLFLLIRQLLDQMVNAEKVSVVRLVIRTDLTVDAARRTATVA